MKKGRIVFSGDRNNVVFVPKTPNETKFIRESFGWLSADYNQSVVNPDINLAIAKKEDFIPFVFRHITATIVGGESWKATEFTEESLKAGASKLKHKPAYVNHEIEIGNNIGVIGEVTYTPAKKVNGIDIPAGLDAPIWIDGKLHTDLCRKLSGYPVPHIQSVSVTVDFEWKPSHEFLDAEGNFDEYAFMCNVGKYVDGKMVRRVVTKIIDFYETSLVWLGADPFAKIKDESGTLLNIEVAGIVDKKAFDKEPKHIVDAYNKDNTIYLIDNCFGKEEYISLTKQFENKYSKTGKSEKMKLNLIGKKESYSADVIAKLEEIAELTFVENTTDTIELDNLKKDKTQLSNDLKKSNDELVLAKKTISTYSKIVAEDKLEEVSKDIDLGSIVSLAKSANDFINKKKEEAISLYKKAHGDKANEAIIKQIQNSDDEALNGYLEQYGSSLIEQFGASCKDCKSNNVSFRSSKADTGENGDTNFQVPSLASDFRE